MALTQINWHPSRTECRRFGWVALVASALVAALLAWWQDLSLVWTGVLVGAGVVIFALSLISAKLVRPVFVGLTLVTWPIGWVVSFVILAVFYYIVLTPIGLVLRLFRRDPLTRGWEDDAETYWVPHRQPESAKRYFNQF